MISELVAEKYSSNKANPSKIQFLIDEVARLRNFIPEDLYMDLNSQARKEGKIPFLSTQQAEDIALDERVWGSEKYKIVKSAKRMWFYQFPGPEILLSQFLEVPIDDSKIMQVRAISNSNLMLKERGIYAWGYIDESKNIHQLLIDIDNETLWGCTTHAGGIAIREACMREKIYGYGEVCKLLAERGPFPIPKEAGIPEQKINEYVNNVIFRGLVSGALASAVVGKAAHADVVGTDTAAITGLGAWFQAKYLIVFPYIKMIKDNYEAVKGYVDDFNRFVTEFNKSMNWLKDVRTLLTEPQENVFYQQYKQIVDYIDGVLKQKDNDLLTFRLHYFNPILIAKIDSMTAQVEGLYSRAKSITGTYKKSGGKFEPKIDEVRQTKLGKLAIRISNDQAKYFEALSNIYAIKDSVKVIQSKLLPEFMKKNKSSKNSMEIYNEMILPKILDAVLNLNSIQVETYQKLNDIFMVLSKEEPIISDSEEFIKRDKIRKLIEQIQKSSLHNEEKFIA
ncbi:unnamed protein product [Diamesa hyperborea]